MKIARRDIDHWLRSWSGWALAALLALGMQTAGADTVDPADPAVYGLGVHAPSTPLDDAALGSVRGLGADWGLKVDDRVAVVLWDELNKQSTPAGEGNGQITVDHGSNNRQMNSIQISRQ